MTTEATTTAAHATTVAASPETFSREYVSELRNENKAIRIKAQEAETKAQAAEAAAAKAAQDATENVTKAQQAANERIIRAELKAAALKAGMVDLDGLKLADLSKVKLNDAGEVEGAEELMEDLKKSKSYLFSAANTTSTTVTPPGAKKTEAKSAKDMTPEEYAAERAKIR